MKVRIAVRVYTDYELEVEADSLEMAYENRPRGMDNYKLIDGPFASGCAYDPSQGDHKGAVSRIANDMAMRAMAEDLRGAKRLMKEMFGVDAEDADTETKH